ncbi:MAG: hypothetical protein KDJ50_01435 [Alphaproteobacteria bacterium]|nr:hypothetical protein [Alphaproteobacteria bacterium]
MMRQTLSRRATGRSSSARTGNSTEATPPTSSRPPRVEDPSLEPSTLTKKSGKENSVTLSSMPTDKLLQSVLDRMERLVILYTQEIDVLGVGDMHKFQMLQPEKIRLVRDCENGISQISVRKEEMGTCDEALKSRLLVTHNALQDLALQSKRSCEARSKSVRRIQERLLEAARATVNKNSNGYGRTGKLDSHLSAKPLATAINQAV